MYISLLSLEFGRWYNCPGIGVKTLMADSKNQPEANDSKPQQSATTVQNSLQWRHNERDGVSITSLTIVYSTVYSGADQRKYQSPASLASVRGIHRWLVISPHKWPVMRKMLPFDDGAMLSDLTDGLGPCIGQGRLLTPVLSVGLFTAK